MRLPNFLIIGAMKGGTTSLYRYLDQHPDLYMSPVKEPRFFALENDSLDYRGPNDPSARCAHKDIESFAALFDIATIETALGEASALYLYHRDAAPQIKKYVPDMKLIAVLRHPAERAYSNYIWCLREGLEPLRSFREGLDAEDERVAKRWGHAWHYKRRGFYYDQLRLYYELFDQSQIRIFLYEDLRSDAVVVAKEIFGFLGVDESFTPDVSRDHNISGIPRSRWLHDFLIKDNPVRIAMGKLLPAALRDGVAFQLRQRILRRAPRMDPQIRQELVDLYRDDIGKLQQLIGRDLSSWLQ